MFHHKVNDLSIKEGYKLIFVLWECHTCLHAKFLQLCLTFCDPMDVDHQAYLSVGFSRQEYLSGFPCPYLMNLTDPGIKPASPQLLYCRCILFFFLDFYFFILFFPFIFISWRLITLQYCSGFYHTFHGAFLVAQQ